MPRKGSKKKQATKINIYIKPVDFGLYDWARSQRQSLSEVIALALQEYHKKHEK